jgi:hypothetical protein
LKQFAKLNHHSQSACQFAAKRISSIHLDNFNFHRHHDQFDIDIDALIDEEHEIEQEHCSDDVIDNLESQNIIDSAQ